MLIWQLKVVVWRLNLSWGWELGNLPGSKNIGRPSGRSHVFDLQQDGFRLVLNLLGENFFVNNFCNSLLSPRFSTDRPFDGSRYRQRISIKSFNLSAYMSVSERERSLLQ